MAESARPEPTRRCPSCEERMPLADETCPHCAHELYPRLREAEEGRRRAVDRSAGGAGNLELAVGRGGRMVGMALVVGGFLWFLSSAGSDNRALVPFGVGAAVYLVAKRARQLFGRGQ